MPFLLSNQSMEALKKLKALSRKNHPLAHHYLQCFDAVGWTAGRASDLEKN